MGLVIDRIDDVMDEEEESAPTSQDSTTGASSGIKVIWQRGPAWGGPDGVCVCAHCGTAELKLEAVRLPRLCPPHSCPP